MSLAGKSALVTGGSRGIGYAIAAALHRDGANVMISARDAARTEDAARTIGGGSRRIHGTPSDVSDPDSVWNLIEKTVGTFGTIDILVNNAGIGILANVEDMTIETWRATIDTNLSGAFYCCHYAIPVMKRRGGDIINVASRSSVNAYATGAAYCASKFGLLGFSEALNLEVRRHNIRVSCIMPGRVSTDFAGETPQDWHLTVDDVAQTVVSVLSLGRHALASRVELRPANPPNA